MDINVMLADFLKHLSLLAILCEGRASVF